ncbi:MAG: aldolase [Polaromonas sp.]|uniref:HpcH/HpaI aldolase family protein n=1 Tax=Polaromonas sp. TaxID=1869339 RepID=UPI0025EDB5A3|nr:aldolase/citrate lyase family protein [Polaromonas sp.]MBI2725791.1 aldolase [Polaromonas sp.]
MPIVLNPALQRLRNKQIALGFGVSQLRGAIAPQLASAAGYHWLSIDTEHGAFTLGEVAQICIAALPVGITPIVRVRPQALDEGARALDNGAQGVIVPNVNTVEDARRLVEAFRYPDRGTRNWGPNGLQFGWDIPPVAQAQQEMDREVLVIAMLETAQGIANADAIASVAGIDMLFIGAVDLSIDLGIPGQFGHEHMRKAFRDVSGICQRHGKYLGMGGVYDEEITRSYMAMNATFVAGGSDQAFLLAEARKRARFLEQCGASGESRRSA